MTKEAGSYNSFISNLRQRLASGTYAGGVPMLNSEETGRNRWFHIVLISGNSQITLRMQLGNLYFVAFQAANGQWYEFQPEDNRPLLFSNTIMLPYTGRYPNDGTNSQIIVGRDRLASVINSLASFNPNNPNNRQLLLTLIVMFPEAVRFTRVADFVYARMHDPSTPESGIGTMLARLVQEWGALSMEMRRSDLFASFRELDIDGLGISSASQAALALGIGLWSNKGPPTGPAFSTNALSDVTSKGRQLVEIFWVQILNIDNENPGDLYGKIQVVDGLTTPQYIFNRSRENYLSIGPKVRLWVILDTNIILIHI